VEPFAAHTCFAAEIRKKTGSCAVSAAASPIGVGILDEVFFVKIKPTRPSSATCGGPPCLIHECEVFGNRWVHVLKRDTRARSALIFLKLIPERQYGPTAERREDDGPFLPP